VLKRDLAEHIGPCAGLDAGQQGTGGRELTILDAGGGQGQLAVALAATGHRVDLCDISANMLALAAENAQLAGVEERVRLRRADIHQVCAENPQGYELILCHAVLEWVAEPERLLASLYHALKPGGHLSLTFYNVNGMIMKNLLRTNFTKVLTEDYRGYRGSLTPTWPRAADEVRQWLVDLDLTLECHSGIRCFHDYLLDPAERLAKPEQQLALELKLSRREPFRSLGRYIHLLVRRG